MKPFHESDRYEYPLTKDSIVFDCGGYEGRFAAEIHRRYGCRVTVFEPIPAFHDRIKERFASVPMIEVRRLGIGGTTRTASVSMKGDSSGLFATGESYPAIIIGIEDAIMHLDTVDLLKLNVEGMEFEILEAVISKGLSRRFKNIQVQFHPIVEKCEERWKAIRESLLSTHKLTFDAPWCWENHELIS